MEESVGAQPVATIKLQRKNRCTGGGAKAPASPAWTMLECLRFVARSCFDTTGFRIEGDKGAPPALNFPSRTFEPRLPLTPLRCGKPPDVLQLLYLALELSALPPCDA